MTALASYYDRLPAPGSGGGASNEDPFDGDNLAKLIQMSMADEIAQARQENRQPDFARVGSQISDMKTVFHSIRDGVPYKRNAQGQIIYDMADPAGGPGGGGPPGGVPGGGGPPLERPFSQQLVPGDVTDTRGPGQVTPAELAAQNSQRTLGIYRDQVSNFSAQDVDKYLAKFGPALITSQNPEDKVKLQVLRERRQEIARGKASTESVMSGGGIR